MKTKEASPESGVQTKYFAMASGTVREDCDVPSRNVHENKEHSPKREVRSRKALAAGAAILTPSSRLLTPLFKK
jgi:hypothetical protein